MAMEGSSGEALVQAESYFKAKASFHDLLDTGHQIPDYQNLRGFFDIHVNPGGLIPDAGPCPP